MAHNAAGTGGGSFSGASVSLQLHTYHKVSTEKATHLSQGIYRESYTYPKVSDIIYRESYTLIPRYLTFSLYISFTLNSCELVL
jgi:hypothetical protein